MDVVGSGCSGSGTCCHIPDVSEGAAFSIKSFANDMNMMHGMSKKMIEISRHTCNGCRPRRWSAGSHSWSSGDPLWGLAAVEVAAAAPMRFRAHTDPLCGARCSGSFGQVSGE